MRATLTARLLAFARRQPLDPKRIDVNKLVVGMSELLRRTLGKPFRIEAVLAGGICRVAADAMGSHGRLRLCRVARRMRDQIAPSARRPPIAAAS